jgi:hypothetical protein
VNKRTVGDLARNPGARRGWVRVPFRPPPFCRGCRIVKSRDDFGLGLARCVSSAHIGCKQRALSQSPPLPLTVTFTLFVWLLLPVLALVLLVDLATMGTERRAQMLRRSGLSQAAIAQRLGISRYRVRLALA